MVFSAVTNERPINALLAQFRIMSAIGAPLDAWETFERELVNEQEALRADPSGVDREYVEELVSVLASVGARIGALRGGRPR